MKLESKFVIMSVIALCLLSGFLYIYWWGYINDVTEFPVHMDLYGEFIGEFIGLHIVLFIIIILFSTFFYNIIKNGVRGWHKKKKRCR